MKKKMKDQKKITKNKWLTEREEKNKRMTKKEDEEETWMTD